MSLEKSIHISIFKMQVYAFQGPILPGQHSIERYLIEEQLKHILQANRIERKDWYVSLIKISYLNFNYWRALNFSIAQLIIISYTKF